VPSPPSQFPDLPLGQRERRAVSLAGSVARQDGSTFAVQLSDLSYQGCGVETSASQIQPDRKLLQCRISSAIQFLSAAESGRWRVSLGHPPLSAVGHKSAAKVPIDPRWIEVANLLSIALSLVL
jgi:hypothetical protein